MATLKLGLDYFPMNVDFFSNDKLQLVSARFGITGENIVLRLLCKVYANGYFYRFDDDEMVLLGKNIGSDCGYVLIKEILEEVIKRRFFDKNIYEHFRILTSEGIQRRYLEATGRRKYIELHEQLLLVVPPKTPNVIILKSNVCIITPNGDIIRQRKGKETKLKESKCETPDSLNLDKDYEKYLAWIAENAPYCASEENFPHQITQEEFRKLRTKYSSKEIANIIEQLENRKDLRKRYTNLYRTVLNWAQREYEN